MSLFDCRMFCCCGKQKPGNGSLSRQQLDIHVVSIYFILCVPFSAHTHEKKLLNTIKGCVQINIHAKSMNGDSCCKHFQIIHYNV